MLNIMLRFVLRNIRVYSLVQNMYGDCSIRVYRISTYYAVIMLDALATYYS